MPLTFGAATTDKVIIPASGLGTTGFNGDPHSGLVWCRPTALTDTRRMLSKATIWRMLINGTSGDWEMVVAGTSGSYVYSTTDTPLKVNQWFCLGWTFNSANGAGLRLKLYTGTLNSPMKANAISAVTDTGVSMLSGNASMIIGNTSASGTTAFPGQIASWQFFNGVEMSVSDFTNRQRNYNPTGAYYSARVGSNGTGLVLDENGNNNHGSISGATVSTEYLPRVLRPRRVA